MSELTPQPNYGNQAKSDLMREIERLSAENAEIKRLYENGEMANAVLRIELAESMDEVAALKGNAEPVAWMTEDGRVATNETKQTAMPRVARDSFNIPLYTSPRIPEGDKK